MNRTDSSVSRTATLVNTRVKSGCSSDLSVSNLVMSDYTSLTLGNMMAMSVNIAENVDIQVIGQAVAILDHSVAMLAHTTANVAPVMAYMATVQATCPATFHPVTRRASTQARSPRHPTAPG